MEDRLKRGYEKMLEVEGRIGKSIERNLNDIFPDLVKYIIEYVWGDIYSRDIIDIKTKEIVVVSALTAMGNAPEQLDVHINGALNVGCTVNEIKEIMLQMSAYSGFPTCINGINILKNVIDKRKKEGVKDIEGDNLINKVSSIERYKVGLKELSELDDKQINILKENYDDFFPDLVDFIVCGQADIMSRNNLNKRYREIATISALTALGIAWPQLKFHINAGLNLGLTVDEIKEIMLLITVYSGFPKAINGINILKEVLIERNSFI